MRIHMPRAARHGEIGKMSGIEEGAIGPMVRLDSLFPNGNSSGLFEHDALNSLLVEEPRRESE